MSKTEKNTTPEPETTAPVIDAPATPPTPLSIVGQMNPEIAALAEKSDGELRAQMQNGLNDTKVALTSLRLSARGMIAAGIPITEAFIESFTKEAETHLMQASLAISGQKARAAKFAIAKQRRSA